MTEAVDSLPIIGLSTLPMADLVRSGAIVELRAATATSVIDEVLIAVALAQIGVMESDGQEPGALARLENVVASVAGQRELHLASRIEQAFAQLEALKPRGPILDALMAIENELGAVEGPAGDALRARSALVRGRTLLRSRKIAEARTAVERSVSLSETAGDKYGVAEAGLALGMIEAWNGRPRRAESHFARAAEIWAAFSNRIRLGDVSYESGICAFDTREYGKARELFDQAREIADAAQAGQARLLRIGYQQGAAALAAGDIAVAEKHLSVTHEAAVKAGDTYRARMCAIDLGRCAIRRARKAQGKPREAALSQAKGAYADAYSSMSEQDREPGAFDGLHATLLEADLMCESAHPEGGLTPVDAADLLGRSADAFATLDRERPRCLMFRLAAAEAYGVAASALQMQKKLSVADQATIELMKSRQRGEAAAACELAATMGVNLKKTEPSDRLLALGSSIETRDVSGRPQMRIKPEGGDRGTPWFPLEDASGR